MNGAVNPLAATMVVMKTIEPRLLKTEDAARYCGLDRARFLRECTVAPVNLGDKTRRWDRKALDAWIDGLALSPETMSADDWLGEGAGGGARGGKAPAGAAEHDAGPGR